MNTPADQLEPVRIFLSYASEDEDIMLAFSQAFDRLRELSNSRIATIYDKKSFEVGSPVPLIKEISGKLYRSDCLLILYTGALKKSFSWTGTELGIFWGFIRADERESGSSTRQIVVVYFDEKPPVDWGGLGINLEISPPDLRRPKDEFEQKVRGAIEGGQHQYDALVNTLVGIGALADLRFQTSQPSDSPTQWANYVAKRATAISDEIVPSLMSRLHESISRRVKRTRVEQRLIEFQIPKTFQAADDGLRLPEDAQLIEHGDAFSLFTKAGMESPVSWRAFKSALAGNSESVWITAAIERSVVSAIAPDIDRDDEQIIRISEDREIYRLIVTRRFEFYDGSAMAHMYFIPALRFAFLEDSDAAVTLGFINVATKYREIFLNKKSDLSLLNYYTKPDFDELRSKVRRSIRQLLIIEDESHILKLDKWESITRYFGVASEAEAKHIGEMNGQWKVARKCLIDAAQVVLKAVPTASEPENDKALNLWVDALGKFVDVSDRINSTALSRAIANLGRYLSVATPPGVVPESDKNGAATPGSVSGEPTPR
ncbi:hypothetical protein [Bradyrhizobium sp. th.b2]|uniref:hypothetical protein n=1 Tax=Bradyrhizobium sp. th-b2 TaxID=172088 RepID=UPI0012EC8C03|nr:hypothetical protein [Bradyrhizobium sp. th.b2]